MSNPTVFPVTIDDASDIVWLVDNAEPVEMVVPHTGTQILQSSPQETLDLIKATLENHGTIFASFYRPGAFWEEEMFVCPKCKYATHIDCMMFPAEVAELAEWYCKYCYTAWSCSTELGMFRVNPPDDEQDSDSD